jgi:CRISPR-associated protein Cmr3
MEGMLYSTRHIRLRAGVALGAEVTGIPKSWRLPFGEVIPLGGESRLCELAPAPSDSKLGQPVAPSLLDELSAHGRLMVIALTPLDLEPRFGAGLGFPPVFGEIELISACVDQAQRIGGWDSLQRGPLPLRNVVPAGSVLFCEMKEPHRLKEGLMNGMPPQIGANRAWGFGVIALGTWSEGREKQVSCKH